MNAQQLATIISTIIAFICHKGGVGKSEQSANSAAWLASQGHTVLYVNCDTQPDGSDYLIKEMPKGKEDGFRKFIDMDSLDPDAVNDLIVDGCIDNLYVLPSNGSTKKVIPMSMGDHGIDGTASRFRFLASLGYDYVIFDPQSDSIYSDAAMRIANKVVIPTKMMDRDTKRAFATWDTAAQRNTNATRIFVPTMVHLNPVSNPTEMETMLAFYTANPGAVAPHIPYRDAIGRRGNGVTIWDPVDGRMAPRDIRFPMEWMSEWIQNGEFSPAAVESINETIAYMQQALQ